MKNSGAGWRVRGLRPQSLAVLSGALALAVVGWQQVAHGVMYGFHDEGLGAAGWHWVRDAGLAMPWAVVAVVGGLALVSRHASTAAPGRAAVIGAAAVSTAFGLLLVPMVAAHRWLDGSGALGSIVPAPGAGYLDAEGFGSLENASGLGGVALHGARDAVISFPVSMTVVAIGLLWFANRDVRSPQVAARTGELELPGYVPTATPAPAGVSRREALKFGGAGAATLAAGSAGLVAFPAKPALAEAGTATPWLTGDLELVMNDGIVDMIDRTPVYMLGYGYANAGVDGRDELHTPGPVVWGYEGEEIRLTVTNDLADPHSFVIDGVVDSGPIEPGGSRELVIVAPAAGTYLYADGVNAPVNRVLGLQGTLISMPADRSMRCRPDLAAEYWTFATQWVWVFNQIDPSFNARAQAGLPIDPDDFVAGFLPRYFTINGRMGSLAAHAETAPDTVIEDRRGRAALVRIVNGGLSVHGPHFHGNHVFPLVRDRSIESPIMWKDTVRVDPGGQVDVLIPFFIPPNAVYWPPHPDGVAILEQLHGKDMEGTWPMHCHIEMSQSAAGGLYPQGLLTDWKMKP